MARMVRTVKRERVLASSAHFEQIWRIQKRKKEAIHENGPYKMCDVHDVVCVGEEEISRDTNVHEVQVDYDDEIYDDAADSEYETDDSKGIIIYLIIFGININIINIILNCIIVDTFVTTYSLIPGIQYIDICQNISFSAEDNPINDYPEEETCEDEEDISRSSGHESEDSEGESDSNRSSVLEDSERHYEDDDLFFEDDMYGDDDDYNNKIYSGNDDREDEDMRWGLQSGRRSNFVALDQHASESPPKARHFLGSLSSSVSSVNQKYVPMVCKFASCPESRPLQEQSFSSDGQATSGHVATSWLCLPSYTGGVTGIGYGITVGEVITRPAIARPYVPTVVLSLFVISTFLTKAKVCTTKAWTGLQSRSPKSIPQEWDNLDHFRIDVAMGWIGL
ncbi:hypothetical protein RJ641_032689 [Dillenia turbinata]|uniref:Uncharacterized protein n=1 Tax=Dillenia turbinata TaxID=194707 RepID=A0AAN8VPU7_9MAGN